MRSATRRVLPVLLILAGLAVLTFTMLRSARPPGDAGHEISPAELAALMQGPSASRPLVLQIGFRVMYLQAHIPGSEFVGPTDDPAALEALRARVAPLARDASIVVYCGCCPWDRCPNVTPAMKALAAMGFTRAKVLRLPTDFGTDWVSKGYPVESGG